MSALPDCSPRPREPSGPAFHPYRDPVFSVPESVQRPLWSVMIPTYHCAAYLRETLASVLVQAPRPELMQIEVVDDHSTEDDPASVVGQMGQGRVDFYRQPTRMGITRNFHCCLTRARGRLVHLLHGDDCVRPGFYQALQRAFHDRPDLGAAFCRHIYMDERGHWQAIAPLEQPASGVLPNALARLASEQRIMTPAIAVRRDVYEALSGFDRRLLCAEDWEMWVRIAARYPIWYEAEPLAIYRMHGQSNTGRHVRRAADVEYNRQAIDIFRSYLPPATAAAIARHARETYALSALETADAMLTQRDTVAACAQARAALRCRPSWRVVRRLLRLLLRAIGGLLGRRTPLTPTANEHWEGTV